MLICQQIRKSTIHKIDQFLGAENRCSHLCCLR